MEEIVNEKTTEKGLTLLDLWIVIQKYWLQLISVSVVVAVAVGIAAYFTVDRTYTASTRLMINANSVYETSQSSSVSNAINSKNFGLSLFPSIKDMILSTNTVRNKLSDLSDEELRDFYNDWASDISDEKYNDEYISVKQSVKRSDLSCSRSDEDSLIFTISYTSNESPEVAKSTVNALSLSLIKVADTPKSFKEDGVTVDKYSYPFGGMLSPVELAKSASASHNWSLYPVIAFFGAFVLVYVYFLLLSIFDDSVRSKQEIEEITGFNVIAYIEDLTEKKSKRRS